MTRLRSLWPDDPSATPASRLERIASAASPEDAAWLRDLAGALDPRLEREAGTVARDAALRAAARLIEGANSAIAKTLEADLRRYLAGAWRRGERKLAKPPQEASELRRHLWRVAKLTDGEGLGWRRILQIIEM